MSADQLSRLALGLPDPDGMTGFDRLHVRECATCRSGFRTALRALSSGPDPMHDLTPDPACPSEDELIRYVDGLCDAVETQALELHLEDCAGCAADVETLREAQAESMQADPAMLLQPARNAASAARRQEPRPRPDGVSPRRRGWRERLRDFFTLRQVPAFAAGAAAALLALMLVPRAGILVPQATQVVASKGPAASTGTDPTFWAMLLTSPTDAQLDSAVRASAKASAALPDDPLPQLALARLYQLQSEQAADDGMAARLRRKAEAASRLFERMLPRGQ